MLCHCRASLGSSTSGLRGIGCRTSMCRRVQGAAPSCSTAQWREPTIWPVALVGLSSSSSYEEREKKSLRSQPVFSFSMLVVESVNSGPVAKNPKQSRKKSRTKPETALFPATLNPAPTRHALHCWNSLHREMLWRRVPGGDEALLSRVSFFFLLAPLFFPFSLPVTLSFTVSTILPLLFTPSASSSSILSWWQSQ